MNIENSTFLILGSQGQLGKEFSRTLAKRGIRFTAPPEREADITNPESLRRLTDEVHSDVIINCAAYNAVDAAEDDSRTAYLINQDSVDRLARVARERGSLLVHFGTDYVFDGSKENLYVEEDSPNPLSVYGRSKLGGEQAVLGASTRFLVFRLSWVYGEGTQNFIHKLRQWASQHSVLHLSADEVSVPTSTIDVADVVLKALAADLRGLHHLTNSGYASRYEFGKHVVETLNLDNVIVPVPMDTFKTKAKRPRFSAMSNAALSQQLGVSIPDWRTSLDHYLLASAPQG
jgi:dTDP-4-dehydrorhamnose reductase